MAAIPEPTHGTAALIHDLYERRAAAQQPREYLGWSKIGETCDRALWMSFRWAEREQIEGRIARLFDTGQREEDRVLQDLRDAGVQVWDRDPATGKQFAVWSVRGHLRGHLDAIALGLPEAPKTAHVVDVKTANTKKFNEVMKHGLRATYPKYWAQGMGYMGHMQLTRAAFIFVCKDDDRIHIERFDFDQSEFDRLEQRAERIVSATEPPPRISSDPADSECRYCAFRDICHGTAAPQVNCRTCCHSTPVDEGQWSCAKYGETIPVEHQREGCADHRYIPVLLERFAKPVDADSEANTVTYESESGTWVNGAPPAGFTSAEIRAAKDKKSLPLIARSGDLQALRAQWGAEVVA